MTSQKKIFKMSDIENCSFNCILAENTPNRYETEFRSTSMYGNFNVFELASQFRGGGHYNASGCYFNRSNSEQLATKIKMQAIKNYIEQGENVPEIVKSEQDEKLSSIFEETNRLTKNVTPEILKQVDEMIKNGANYEYTYKKMKSFKTFMLENEILSTISNNKLTERTPSINIYLSQEQLAALMKRYEVKEDDILNVISVFENIDVRKASIILPDGRKSQISADGKIRNCIDMEERCKE